MTLRRMLVAALSLLSLALASSSGTRKQDAEKHRGVSWVGGRHAVTPDNLRPLKENGVEWIVQTPFGWQRGHQSPQVRLNPQARLWGESDEGLRVTAQMARGMGIETLLKPHIWVTDRQQGKWRSDIAMSGQEQWEAWFESYTEFILHYARLAEQEHMAAFCVGTELHGTIKREDQWRRLIARVRQVYSGKITYAANWWSEFEEVRFWDALDYIGVQAYFPLAGDERPQVEQLTRGWEPHLKRLQALAERYNKRILFTEIGYRSAPEAAIEPWTWPQNTRRREVCWETQANAYEAFFQAVWPQEWLAGAFFWKWYPEVPDQQGENVDFTPQGKPAENVIRRYYKALDQP